MSPRIILAGLLGTLVAATGASSAQAQAFPDREIKIVVGYPAGGPTDTLARVLADKLSVSLKQRVLVENRAGANGATATRAVAKSAADGYTLILNASNMGLNLYGMREPGYTWDDFTVVSGLAYGPLAMVVNTTSSKAKTLKEFVAFGKANPNKLKFASLGPQSIQNVVSHRLSDESGISWREVPYKGATTVVPDLLNGIVDGYFTLPVTATQIIKEPNIAVLAVTDKQRVNLIPDVPTFSELGYPAVNDYALAGIWAPAATPKPVVEKLRTAIADALKLKDLKQRYETTGYLVSDRTPEQFDADARKQALQYRDDFKKLGIEPQ